MAATKAATTKKPATGKEMTAEEIDAQIRALEAAKRDRLIESGVVDKSQFQSWQGPFTEYTMVTTPFGEHAVPAFQILSFSMSERINRKTMESQSYAVPHYRDATDAELKAFGLLEAKDYLLPANDRRRPPPKGDAVEAKDLGYSPSPMGTQVHEKSVL